MVLIPVRLLQRYINHLIQGLRRFLLARLAVDLEDVLHRAIAAPRVELPPRSPTLAFRVGEFLRDVRERLGVVVLAELDFADDRIRIGVDVDEVVGVPYGRLLLRIGHAGQ